MLINLSSNNSRTGGQQAYDFTNDFDEPIEFKRNASIKVLKVWLNRQEEFVITGSNQKFQVGFGDPSAPKNAGYITTGTYTGVGLATALEDAFNRVGFQEGFIFDVNYHTEVDGGDKSAFTIEWTYQDPERVLTNPSGTTIATNFTYTATTGVLLGSADAVAKICRCENALALDNIPLLRQKGAGFSFKKDTNTNGLICGLCRGDPVVATDTSIPFQFVFGGTGATDLTAGTFIIREDNDGANRTITYGETAYNDGDWFRALVVKDSDHIVYQRNIYTGGTLTGWENIATNTNLQMEVDKFGEWFFGAMTSTTIGLISATQITDIKGATTSTITTNTAEMATETNPSTTMEVKDNATFTDACVCIVAGPLSVNGATFTDVGSTIPAGSTGVVMGVLTTDKTGDITFGFEDTAATKTTDLMTYAFFYNQAAGRLEARAGGVMLASVVDANWANAQDLVLHREIHGGRAVITFLYHDDNTDIQVLATATGAGLTAYYLSVGARVVDEGVGSLRIGTIVGTDTDHITFYPDTIGDMIGFKNTRYYMSKGADSDADPEETTSRNPNVILNITNLPVKSYQGYDGKVNKMVQSLNRVSGGGQQEIEVFNPVSIPLHNAEPLMFNQLHLTLTNNDGTYATDFVDTTNVLLEVSAQEGTA